MELHVHVQRVELLDSSDKCLPMAVRKEESHNLRDTQGADTKTEVKQVVR